MEYYLFAQDNTEYNIGNTIAMIIVILLILLVIFTVIKGIAKKEKETKACAKILFKSIGEYDRTRYPDLTTYHVTNYFLDCLIDGKTMTFNCSEYMYDYVQNGETYDVTYKKHTIELDRKYYPDNFDDFFVDGSDDYDDYENEE